MTPETTPAEQYDTRLDAIMTLLDEIRGDVAIHNIMFDRAGRRNWGFVGDLTHVEAMLQEVHNFLNNKE